VPAAAGYIYSRNASCTAAEAEYEDRNYFFNKFIAVLLMLMLRLKPRQIIFKKSVRILYYSTLGICICRQSS
jgi:hypothetical protein